MKLISSGTTVNVKAVRACAAAAILILVLCIIAYFLLGAADIRSSEDDMSQKVAYAVERMSIDAAKRLYLSHDYESALWLLKPYSGDEVELLRAEIEKVSKTLVEADIYEIPHVFFHSLIADTQKAFDGDSREAGYNQVMTTVDEFSAILNQMYERGFVLVSIHDVAKVNPDGTVTPGKILLPEGKRPFVLSVDDVCYYEYMEGDGFASRITVGQDGKPTCLMKQEDGSFLEGDFDVVPILDAFIEEHPDFSYRGARGILAFTGYNGVLGYRTCPSYSDNPTYEEDVREAKRVARVLRNNGWEFASHSWGHRNMGTMAFENFKIDTDRWEAEVEPIIGDTDILIFPFGADIENWKNYKQDNPRFAYLKKVGFDYFCNVDGNRAWLQLGKNYVRQGRRNLDGYRMYYDMINENRDWLSDLFDVDEVFDKSRPTPVPPM